MERGLCPSGLTQRAYLLEHTRVWLGPKPVDDEEEAPTADRPTEDVEKDPAAAAAADEVEDEEDETKKRKGEELAAAQAAAENAGIKKKGDGGGGGGGGEGNCGGGGGGGGDGDNDAGGGGGGGGNAVVDDGPQVLGRSLKGLRQNDIDPTEREAIMAEMFNRVRPFLERNIEKADSSHSFIHSFDPSVHSLE